MRVYSEETESNNGGVFFLNIQTWSHPPHPHNLGESPVLEAPIRSLVSFTMPNSHPNAVVRKISIHRGGGVVIALVRAQAWVQFPATASFCFPLIYLIQVASNQFSRLYTLVCCIYLKFLDGLLLLASNGHHLPILLV